MQKFLEFLTITVVAFLILCLGDIIGTNKAQRGSTIEEKVRVDTLLRVDTLMLREPVYVSVRTIDTMLVAVTDTIIRNDTTFVTLPRQQRKYVTPYYDAWVSGYNPNLDSIKLYQKTKYVNVEKIVREKVKPHWGAGVQVGYGVGREGLSPYIGLGIQYNFVTW